MWILLSILALLLFLLSMPVTVSAAYREEVTLQLQYLFFHMGILPAKKKTETEEEPKKKKKEKKQTKENSGQPKPKKKLSLDSVLEILELVKQALSSLKNPLGWFLRKLRYRDLWLDVLVCKEDAHQTALRYGQVQAVFHSVFSMLRNSIDITTTEIRINADFIGEEEHFSGGVKVKLRPIHVLIFAFWFAGSFGIGYLKRKHLESKLQKELKSKTRETK